MRKVLYFFFSLTKLLVGKTDVSELWERELIPIGLLSWLCGRERIVTQSAIYTAEKKKIKQSLSFGNRLRYVALSLYVGSWLLEGLPTLSPTPKSLSLPIERIEAPTAVSRHWAVVEWRSVLLRVCLYMCVLVASYILYYIFGLLYHHHKRALLLLYVLCVVLILHI